MRNLRNYHRSVITNFDTPLPLTATAWDPASDALICTFGPSASASIIELRRVFLENGQPKSQLIASWDAQCPLESLEYDRPLSLQYFADTASACLVLEGGDIILVRESPLGGEDLIEIVGSVDAGITAAAWSPDEELLAISTRAETLLYMTRNLENVQNISFSSDDLQASRHVSVGWGKSETQFKGKRAKALKDPTVPERVDQGTLSSSDQGQVTISWRGDGAYVAVNSIHDKSRRIIRVYSREGTLDSVSEPVDGLEGALSWRPAGNLIAGVQRSNESAKVVFFERNGLRHGQFNLRVNEDDLKTWASEIELHWNADSSVLAVCFADRVQLWTMGNYLYYLKQEIMTLTRSADRSTLQVVWHPERPLKLLVCSAESAQRLDYAFTISRGTTTAPQDYGMVGVIDGRILKLTPFRWANVPPPMAFLEVETAANIIDMAFSPDGKRFGVLHEGTVDVYSYDASQRPSGPCGLDYSVKLESGGVSVLQLSFSGSSELSVFTVVHESNLPSVSIHQRGKLVDTPQSPKGYSDCVTLAPNLSSNTACISQFDPTERATSLESIESSSPTGIAGALRLPAQVPWVEVVEQNGNILAFGLTENGALYASSSGPDEEKSRLLTRDCTSFLLTSAHLIYTTSRHLLKFVHLTTLADLQIPEDEPEKDERCRSIERGAKLVTAVPSVNSVVLQMPRGNLETVYPRAMVVAGIRRSIEALDYKAAFLACRNHRVDMNLLHDHAPEQFMKNISLFIKQLRKVEYIDLFLSQLREEDVSKSMYVETLKPAEEEPATPVTNGVELIDTSKVNKICDAFLQALHSLRATNLQNIITANVCKNPPDLEAGLTLVGKLKADGDDLAERAAEHICFLADVNRLYDNALGLYDLDLTLLIAQQSQKDPREYLPYLQSLQEMPELRRQYTIDNNLGRYTKALAHLHALDEFDELQTYVVKHSLYQEAFKLYKYDSNRYSILMRLYADHLLGRNKYKDAGIAYEYLADYEKAYGAYRLAHAWRECLSCATLVPLPSEELLDLATSLAELLIESKDFISAATIHLDYLSDIEGAVRLSCNGFMFAEGTRIVGLRGTRSMIESIIDPALVEASASMTEMLAECKGQLNAQIPRLRELRQKKLEDPLAFYDGAEAADIPDNVSLAPTDTSTSGGTFMTRYTNQTGTVQTNATRKTSKNRRREERKRARGKKGSVYEEEYLISSIGRLIQRINDINEDVRRLVEGLMRRTMRERASAVEQAMLEVVTACKACIPEVFEVEVKKEERLEDGEQPKFVGADAVFQESLEQMAKKKEPPVVKEFERLSLVD